MRCAVALCASDNVTKKEINETTHVTSPHVALIHSIFHISKMSPRVYLHQIRLHLVEQFSFYDFFYLCPQRRAKSYVLNF